MWLKLGIRMPRIQRQPLKLLFGSYALTLRDRGQLTFTVSNKKMSTAWSPTSVLRITAITYNLNQRKSMSEQMKYLLDEPENEYSDILVIGLQILGAVSLDETWVKVITTYLSTKARVLLARTHLASNVLLIYARPELLALVHKVDSRYVRSKFYGLSGHKGAISLRLNFKDNSSLVLVTSHLSPNAEGYGRRLSEYRQAKHVTFDHHDLRNTAVIWLGDMNFRLNEFESCEEFQDKLSKTPAEKIDAELVERYDQLRQAQRVKDGFAEFREAKIEFPPTYRITVGTDQFDPRRIPAWCDRVLYRGDGLKVLSYRSDRRITISDHFPVIAQFEWQASSDKHGKDLVEREADWNCIFDVPTSSAWFDSVPFGCRFQFVDNFWKRHGSYLDWVGIFDDDLLDSTNPITWIYLLATSDETDETGEHWTRAQFPSLPPGNYRVGYWSWWKGCLHGLSEPFQVTSMGSEAGDETNDKKKKETKGEL